MIRSASSAERVNENTDPAINEKIRHETEVRVAYFATHPEGIDTRLAELDEEWDIERVLQANASSLVVAGTVLSLLRGRRWLIVPLTIGGFLLQHAVQGWCPPLPILRRMGFRTPHEIEAERMALKALRGDFEAIGDAENRRDGRAGDRALEAARA